MAKNQIVADLKNLVRTSSRLYVHAERAYDCPSYDNRGTFSVTGGRKGGKVIVDVPGTLGSGNNDEVEDYTYEGRPYQKYSGVYRPAHGYTGLLDQFSSAVMLLPNDAAVSFHMRLDYGTSEALIPYKLHCDLLYLIAETPKQRYELLVNSSTGHHNSARWGNANHVPLPKDV